MCEAKRACAARGIFDLHSRPIQHMNNIPRCSREICIGDKVSILPSESVVFARLLLLQSRGVDINLSPSELRIPQSVGETSSSPLRNCMADRDRMGISNSGGNNSAALKSRTAKLRYALRISWSVSTDDRTDEKCTHFLRRTLSASSQFPALVLPSATRRNLVFQRRRIPACLCHTRSRRIVTSLLLLVVVISGRNIHSPSCMLPSRWTSSSSTDATQNKSSSRLSD